MFSTVIKGSRGQIFSNHLWLLNDSAHQNASHGACVFLYCECFSIHSTHKLSLFLSIINNFLKS